MTDLILVLHMIDAVPRRAITTPGAQHISSPPQPPTSVNISLLKNKKIMDFLNTYVSIKKPS